MTFVKASLTQMKRMGKQMKEKMERNKKMGKNKKTASDGFKLTGKWPY